MENNKLPSDYIAGFTDGEGCFCLKFRRDVRHERKNKPIYFYWSAEFVILLRRDDLEVLKKIRNTLGCGKINFPKDNARYSVNKINDLIHKIYLFLGNIAYMLKNSLILSFGWGQWNLFIKTLVNQEVFLRAYKDLKR